MKLDAVLKHNGVQGKAGAGADAPRWWQEGKLAHLEQYCKRDVEALVEIVLRPSVRLPGLHSTCGMSVLYAVQGNRTAGGQKRAHGDDERAETDSGVGADEGAAASDAEAEEAAETERRRRNERAGEENQEVANGDGRARRKRKAPAGGYDETKRREPRQRTRSGYMERGQHGGALKRRGIEVGPAVVTRVTRGRYEWRGATLTPLDNG